MVSDHSLVLPKNADLSELPAIVQRAMRMLSEGDVSRARLLAGVAYDSAKAAVKLATKVKASKELVDRARSLQGDAVLIEMCALMAIADAVDEGQKTGAFEKGGRPRNGGSSMRQADAGFDRADVHLGRKIRIADREKAGGVKGYVKQIVSAGKPVSKSAVLRGLTAEMSHSDAALNVRLLSNGEDVSRLRWNEIPQILRDLERDLKLLRRVHGFAVPLDGDDRIKDIVSARTLAEIVAEVGS